MNTVKNCFLLLIGLISPLSPDTDKDVRLTDDNESDDDDDLDQLKTVVENKTCLLYTSPSPRDRG